MRFSRAREAATEVRDTAQKIGNSVQWNTAALAAVCIVSAVALVVAVAALNRTGSHA
jgi:hypothetical protein